MPPTENAAQRADRERNPEWKTRPPTDHDQTWKHENDRRQRACGGRNGLHNVVFLNGRIAETSQDRHRNDRRWNRRRKRETRLEAEVHIGRGEHQRDDDTYDYPTDGKFDAHRKRRIVWSRLRGQDVYPPTRGNCAPRIRTSLQASVERFETTSPWRVLRPERRHADPKSRHRSCGRRLRKIRQAV